MDKSQSKSQINYSLIGISLLSESTREFFRSEFSENSHKERRLATDHQKGARFR